MKIENVKIPDVLYFQEGPGVRNNQFTKNGVKLLNVGNINNGVIDLDATNIYISKEEANGKYKHFLVDEGDLLIASSGIVVDNFHNKIAWAKADHLPLCMNTSTIRFKTLDENRLDIRYFSFYLKTQHFSNQLRKLITGSAQLNFGPSHLKQISLPLPPLTIQKRIAEILDVSDTLKRKDQQLLKKYDELAQSIFIDMFGDPIQNNKGWLIKSIEEVVSFIDYRGKTPERSIKEEVTLITAKNVKFGYYDYSERDFVTNEIYNQIMTRGFPKPGDVLFTTEGATLGNVCRIPNLQKFALGQRLISMSGEKVTSEYLHYILCSSFFQEQVYKYATGSAVKGIRSAVLKKLVIPVPDYELQMMFSKLITILEKQIELGKNSQETSKNMFETLIQKTFTGELIN